MLVHQANQATQCNNNVAFKQKLGSVKVLNVAYDYKNGIETLEKKAVIKVDGNKIRNGEKFYIFDNHNNLVEATFVGAVKIIKDIFRNSYNDLRYKVGEGTYHLSQDSDKDVELFSKSGLQELKNQLSSSQINKDQVGELKSKIDGFLNS